MVTTCRDFIALTPNLVVPYELLCVPILVGTASKPEHVLDFCAIKQILGEIAGLLRHNMKHNDVGSKFGTLESGEFQITYALRPNPHVAREECIKIVLFDGSSDDGARCCHQWKELVKIVIVPKFSNGRRNTTTGLTSQYFDVQH